MASQASKKGKKGKGVKGKTLNLNDFLCDGSSGTSAPGTSYVMTNKSWAEQTDEADESAFLDNKPLPNRAALPTAPRSAQPAELDFSKLPDKPPYTVYLGNIPFDADEDDITNFLSECKVSQVRLPREGERLKGFGYAEVDDLDSLTAALALNDQTIRSRRIRVDVAGPGHQDGQNDRTSGDWRAGRDSGSVFGRGSYGGRREESFGGSGGGGGGSSEDSVWRRQKPAEGSGAFESKGGGSRGFDDRGRSGGFGGDQGDRGFGNSRDNRFGNDRGFGGDRDRGFGGDRDRGFGGDRDRGFGGDRDRSFGGERDRGFGDRGGDRDRGFGGERDRGFGGDRGFGSDRDRGFGGDRGGGRSRGFDNFSEPRDRAFGDRERDRGNRDRTYGADRNGGYSGGYTRPSEDGEMESSEPHKERKKLVLTKKSDHSSNSSSAQQTKSAIFGGAKPVDTAARERAIEERLERERRLEEQERMKSEKEREPVMRRERPERPRRESEGEGRTRHSSSSSGKGGPRPIIARRESERSNEDDSAFHKDEPLSPTSPTTPKSPKTPISPRQDEINLQNVVPAPPPKENAWAKRSEIVSSPPSGSSSVPQMSPPSREVDNRYKGEGAPDGGRQYRETGPPKDNAWKRDGRSAGRGERGGMNRRPGDQGGAGAGRGDRDERRDDRRENRRSESDNKPARKQPAEMPKYEQPTPTDWSQPTKFSSALADELQESD